MRVLGRFGWKWIAVPTFSNSILSWNSCLNVIILFHCTLGNSPKGLAKLGNIVAEILFPDMFPWVTKLGKIRFESKICVCEAKTFLTLDSETFPCFQYAKCASATYVSRAVKLENTCVCSNGSTTMFPCLARSNVFVLVSVQGWLLYEDDEPTRRGRKARLRLYVWAKFKYFPARMTKLSH